MGVFEEKMSVFKPLTPESLARVLAGGGGRSARGSRQGSANRSKEASVASSPKSSASAGRQQGESAAAAKALASEDLISGVKKKQQEPKPNASLVAGKKLPPSFGDYFPKKLYGVPMEDIDPFYGDKKVCCLCYCSCFYCCCSPLCFACVCSKLIGSGAERAVMFSRTHA